MISSKSHQIPFSVRLKQRGLTYYTDLARLGAPVFRVEKAHLFWDLSSLSFGLIRWRLAWEALCSFLVSVRVCAVARLEWLLPPTLVNTILHRQWWARALLYQVKHCKWCPYDCWTLFKTFSLYMRILSKWKKQYLQSSHFWYYFLTILDTVENPTLQIIVMLTVLKWNGISFCFYLYSYYKYILNGRQIISIIFKCSKKLCIIWNNSLYWKESE